MRDGQLDNWKRYLRDNPYRYMMRREYPDLFRRFLCITIGGVRFGAFGNMLLLRQPEKHRVRKVSDCWRRQEAGTCW